MKVNKRIKMPRKHNKKFVDEELSDNEIVDDIFNKKIKHDNAMDGGELWQCLFEGSSEINPEDRKIKKAVVNEILEDVKSDKRGKASRNREHDEDDLFDPLEDEEEVFNILRSNDENASFKWIGDLPESKKFGKIQKSFKQIEDDIPEIMKSESLTKTNREERKLQYESSKKHINKKWQPLIKGLNRCDKLKYGMADDRTDVTCGTLSSTFEPETEFEKELSAAIDNNCKLTEGAALARAILTREQKKSKRINRIKSKRWHKRQKERDMVVAAKLLSKIDDPELASEIRETFEKKRAERRLLRKREAQTKWAKIALRYGGKDLMKEVSAQNQKLRNDEKILDSVKNVVDVEDGESGDEDDEQQDDDEKGVYDKLEVIADPNIPIPDKGLFGLKFMRDAIDKQRSIGEEDDMKECEEVVDSDDNNEIDSTIDIMTDDQGIEVKINECKKRENVEATLPKISQTEIDNAMDEISHLLHNEPNDHNTLEDYKFTTQIASHAYDTTIIPESDDKGNHEETNASDLVKNTKELQPVQTNSPTAERINDASEYKSLDELIDTLELPDDYDKNLKLSRELFIGTTEEHIEESSDDENEIEEDKDHMAGWGSWTGHGIIQEKTQPKFTSVKKSIVKISKKKDKKVSKYYIHNLPHPYNNQHEYNSNMQIPIGPEWNTANVHDKLIQPKVSVMIGSVVMPLGLGKKKHTQLIREYGRRIIKNRTHAKL